MFSGVIFVKTTLMTELKDKRLDKQIYKKLYSSLMFMKFVIVFWSKNNSTPRRIVLLTFQSGDVYPIHQVPVIVIIPFSPRIRFQS